MSVSLPSRPDIAPANRWAVLAVLGVAQLMVVLDATIVNIALPSAQRALHFSTDSGNGSSPLTPSRSAVCCCWAESSAICSDVNGR